MYIYVVYINNNSYYSYNDDGLVIIGIVFFLPLPPVILRQVYEYSNIELDQEDLSFSAFVLDPVPSKLVI